LLGFGGTSGQVYEVVNAARHGKEDRLSKMLKVRLFLSAVVVLSHQQRQFPKLAVIVLQCCNLCCKKWQVFLPAAAAAATAPPKFIIASQQRMK
jgi:hypothetical protein